MKKFKSESKKVLDLMVHSIYTNPEIFLRELISNASDALDKRYISALKSGHPVDRKSLKIEIERAEGRLIIRDNGIGMNEEDLEKNLGTIAHSGSLDFKKEHSEEEEMSIIGQFGVGFYSAFIVADEVEVLTKKEGEDAFLWKSDGVEGYTIEKAEKEGVGTEIRLHLREDTKDEKYSRFLDQYAIQSLVKRYSNYIPYPIEMEVTTQEKVGEGDDAKWKDVQKTEVLNSMIPIWKKRKEDLTDEDYKNFYHDQHYGFDEPLSWIHISVEGLMSYRALLYIPSQLPYDFYTKEYEKGLQLYSSGVLIMDHCEDLLPDYYGFVKGVVDSEDLSLNISRETLQQDRQLRAIASRIETKITEELKRMLKEDRKKYEKFFDAFGRTLKVGIYQSFGAKKDPLADLLLFHVSGKDERKTLKEFTSLLPADAKNLYYVAGESVEKLDKLPVMQALKDKGYPVLYLVDDMDEFVIKMMRNYDEKTFVNVLSEDFKLPGEEEKKEEKEEKNPLLEKMKDLLKDEVVNVKTTSHLTEDAVSLTSTGEISIEMEKALKNQPGAKGFKAQKVLELNPDHPVYHKLEDMMEKKDEEGFEELAQILLDQAKLIAGLPIEDPVRYTRNVLKRL